MRVEPKLPNDRSSLALVPFYILLFGTLVCSPRSQLHLKPKTDPLPGSLGKWGWDGSPTAEHPKCAVSDFDFHLDVAQN